MDVWMLKDWRGLEEVAEVTAFWGEGIGRNSHTLELQELGGFMVPHAIIVASTFHPLSIYLPSEP